MKLTSEELPKNLNNRDFPGGPVVKNPPPNTQDTGSTPGQGAKIPYAAEQLSLRALEPTHN